MDYSQKSLLDFRKSANKNFDELTREFYKYIDWSKKNSYNIAPQYFLSGTSNHVTAYDPFRKETRRMIHFGSNDYLNLTQHPDLINACIEATQHYGTGLGNAPLIGGNTEYHVKLIDKIAEFYSTEDAMVYSSGYNANVGSLTAILGEHDLAILDQYIHASIIDGCVNPTVRTFKHNDIRSLENVLRINSKMNFNTKVICIEGVYSMDGDIAPLPDIVEIARKYNAKVYLDEAHALGIIGKKGKGTMEYYNMENAVDYVFGTFSKSIGTLGGYVASNKEQIEYLRYFASSHMFSASMIPGVAATALNAFDIIVNEENRQINIWNNIHYLKDQLTHLGFNIGNTETAIFPVIIGDNKKVFELSKYLYNNNIIVNTAVFPGVPLEGSRLRISVTQGHTKEDMDTLIYHLGKKGKELGII